MTTAVQEFQFSQDWLSPHLPIWEWLFNLTGKVDRILEVGSFEGRSACWFLQNGLKLTGELLCIDTWEGSPEFAKLPNCTPVGSFERFQKNVDIAKSERQKVTVIGAMSKFALAGLVGTRFSDFDVIYIDGSHKAADVLTDACMAWPLLKVGGVMIFDDYTFCLEDPIEKRPKAAIDAFTSLFNSRIATLVVRDQYVIRKIRS